MDREETNGSMLASWAERPLANQFGKNANGVPFEHIVELFNLTCKDAWITIPEHATDDFIAQLASFMAANLDLAKIAAARRAQGITAPFQLILETSTETWNTGFTAYQTFLAAANANPQ